ncbi:uncharacterized protein LOC135388109 isoform X2 [Ornithodoros turicata]|uniref:uncharacterized protein LOC135388109 isoform X2 n=1 Tax=Ornithodoros turicata TaxID=34597 RepID=UPI0031387BCA
MESMQYDDHDDDSLSLTTTTGSKRKTNAERQRAYRERKKALAEATSTYALFKQVEAERKRAYRERKKALAEATSTYALLKQADAERKRAYRQRKKAEAQATSTYVLLRQAEAERKRAYRQRKKAEAQATSTYALIRQAEAERKRAYRQRKKALETYIDAEDDSCTTSLSSTNGSIEGVKNCAYAMAQLGSVQSGESQEEYIVPSPGDPSAPSTSGISSTSDGSPFFVSDVRSLADAPPVKVKLEVIEEPMGDIEISPHHLPPSAASASLTTPAYSSALETTTKERSLVHSAQAHPVLPSATLGLFSASHVSTQQQQHMQYNCPRTTTAPAASSEDTAPLGTSTRTAKPLRESPALAEHKMNLEIQLLQINKRKAEAELKRLEADERKIVSKMLLIAEEMKRCDDERKKLRAQTEFFLHEKMRSQEELRKNAAITEHHLEEKRKAAASADLLIAQKKTEVLRQRMLLLELRKMRQDHKPRQHSNTIEQHSSSMEQ